MMIVGWVGAGFRDCLFQAIMVGKTRPYEDYLHIVKNLVSSNFALILAAGPLNRSSSARLKTSLGELSANTTIRSGEMLQLAAKYWKIICLENR
jgi:hypothetical protein